MSRVRTPALASRCRTVPNSTEQYRTSNSASSSPTVQHLYDVRPGCLPEQCFVLHKPVLDRARAQTRGAYSSMSAVATHVAKAPISALGHLNLTLCGASNTHLTLKRGMAPQVLKDAVGRATRQEALLLSSQHLLCLAVILSNFVSCLILSVRVLATSPSDTRAASVASYSSRSFGCGTYNLFSVWRTGSTICGTSLPRYTVVCRSCESC